MNKESIEKILKIVKENLEYNNGENREKYMPCCYNCKHVDLENCCGCEPDQMMCCHKGGLNGMLEHDSICEFYE